jgi:hypothetical protein
MDGLGYLSVPGHAARSPRPLTCWDSIRNVSNYISIIHNIVIK